MTSGEHQRRERRLAAEHPPQQREQARTPSATASTLVIARHDRAALEGREERRVLRGPRYHDDVNPGSGKVDVALVEREHHEHDIGT